MLQVMHVWKKISLKLFFPEKKRLLFWALTGPILLIFSSVVLTLPTAPLPSILLVMGVFLLIVFNFAIPKIANLAFFGVALFSILCLKAGSKGFIWFDFFWNVQYLTSLFIAQKMITAAREYIFDSVDSLKSLEDDKVLWEGRFDTLREKLESDREVWEKEIEAAKEEAKEKVAYADSLRRLVETAHLKIRDLEEGQEEKKVTTYDQAPLLQKQREMIISFVDARYQLKSKDQEIETLKKALEENYQNSPQHPNASSAEVAFLKEELEHAKEAEREMIALQKQLTQIQAKQEKAKDQTKKMAALEKRLSESEEKRYSVEDQLKKVLGESTLSKKELEFLREKSESFAQEAKSSVLEMKRLAKEKSELEQLLDEAGKSQPFVIEGKEMETSDVIRLINELNEVREQNYQLEILLSDAKEKLEELQSAVESRRNRNQELLKANPNKPITLQGLAKKLKK